MSIQYIAPAYFLMKEAPIGSPWRQAIKMASQGYELFPLNRNSKNPHNTLAPNGFYDATSDPVVILEWAKKAPEANYGVRTGNGIVGLDHDAHSAIRYSERLGLPETFTVRTPRGGTHAYFRVDGLSRNRTKIWGKAMPADIRGDGGYLVGPGSTVYGKRYEVITSQLVADAPEWLVDEARSTKQNTVEVAFVRPTERSTAPMPESVRRMLADRSDGKNDRIYKVALKLVALGWTDDQIRDAVDGSELISHQNYQRSPVTFMNQKINAARRYVANNPMVGAVDSGQWLTTVTSFAPRGSIMPVMEAVAEVASTSTVFPFSHRDGIAKTGLSKTVVKNALDWAVDSGLLVVVDDSHQHVFKRRVYRLAEVIPERGPQSIVPASPGTAGTNLCGPHSGIHDLTAGNARIRTAATTLRIIQANNGLTLDQLVVKAGKGRSTVYEHVNRLLAARLIEIGVNGYRAVKGLRRAMDILAEKLGLTGYIARIAQVIREERDARLVELNERDWTWQARREQWRLQQARNAFYQPINLAVAA